MRFIYFMVLGAVALGAFWGCAGTCPADLGADHGQLKACPGSPNCVNSQAGVADKTHFISPLTYTGAPENAYDTLVSVVQAMAGSNITQKKKDYLRATFTTALMGFVDDVEFYFPEQPVIHVRSASRKGYSDFGVNRKRIETIRSRFERLLKQPVP